jgi:hypothetical protein
MARWTARCWLGSENGYQDLEVQSNTPHGAKQQFERIYGAQQVINLRQVNNSGGSFGSSGGDSSGVFGLAVILGGIWLVSTYWNFFVALFWIAVAVFGIWAIYKLIRYFTK